MMTQIATCVALQPVDEAKVTQHPEAQVFALIQTPDRAYDDSAAEVALPVEETAIDSAEVPQHHEQTVDIIAPPKFNDTVLAGFRIGYRSDATSTAEKTLLAGGLATQTILQMVGWVQAMKTRLSRKEFSGFVKELLQWVGDEARKYLDIARAFEGFDLSRLQRLEPFTILKLRSKRYAPVVARLQEYLEITPRLVQELIQELLPKKSRKQPGEPISGWKQARSGGGRYYNVLLHDEESGVLIEQQAEAEGILPQMVIAQAVALRAQQKSSPVSPDASVASETEEIQTVVKQLSSLDAENRKLAQELEQRSCQIAELEAKLIEWESREPIEEIAHPELTFDPVANDTQPIVPPRQQLKVIRDAEGYLQTVDTQIQDLNSKLVSPGLDRQTERELQDTLKNRQKLRTTKIDQIVTLADNNGILSDYEQLRSQGRVVLERESASGWLQQAQTWEEIVLVVSSDRAQFLSAVKDWQLEQRQVLVGLLSTYLKREPDALERLAWIPKNLLDKALSNLSFKLRMIAGTSNLLDEPAIEYVSNCDFVSVEYFGGSHEQWMFKDSNDKLYPIVGRDEFEIEI